MVKTSLLPFLETALFGIGAIVALGACVLQRPPSESSLDRPPPPRPVYHPEAADDADDEWENARVHPSPVDAGATRARAAAEARERRQAKRRRKNRAKGRRRQDRILSQT